MSDYLSVIRLGYGSGSPGKQACWMTALQSHLGGKRFKAEWLEDRHMWWGTNNWWHEDEVTHWQPLPPTPTEEPQDAH